MKDPCTTPDCPGDGRYGAPGKGHLYECRYPLTLPLDTDEGSMTGFTPEAVFTTTKEKQ